MVCKFHTSLAQRIDRQFIRASELLLSVSPTKREHLALQPPGFHTSTPARPRTTHSSLHFIEPTHASKGEVPDVTGLTRHPHAPPLEIQDPDERNRELELEDKDADHITTARALMDSREYTRAAHWLKDCKSSKAIFLRVYSEYLVITSRLSYSTQL